MNTNRTLAFEIPKRHRNTVAWRYTQKHMNMIRHRLTFQQLYLFLTTQLSKNLANLSTKPFIQSLFAVLWQYHNMVLTFPLHVGLTLPIFHNGSPCPSGPTSWENHSLKKTLERQSLLNSHRQSRWITVDSVFKWNSNEESPSQRSTGQSGGLCMGKPGGRPIKHLHPA